MKINKTTILIIFFVMLSTSACEIGRISQTQLQLKRYSLKKADLPPSWTFNGESWSVDFGGESYSISYELEKFVFINHTISIYSSEVRAEQAYEEWEAEWFDLPNPELVTSFSPSDQGDDYRFECGQLQPDYPLKFCVYLQRHDDVISFLKFNLDNQSQFNLTFEGINDILSILDERLNEVTIDAKPESVTP